MVGSVLATTARVWVRNLPRFFVLAILAYVPTVAWYLALTIPRVNRFVNEHVYLPLTNLHPAFAMSR